MRISIRSMAIALAFAGSAIFMTSCDKPCPCEQEVVTLTEKNANTTAALGQSIAEMDSVLNAFEQIEGLKSQLSEAQADTNNKDRAAQIRAALDSAFSKSERRLETLNKALAKSNKQKRALQKVVTNLKAQLATAKEQVAALEGKVKTLETTVEAQNQAIQQKDAELNETKGSNEALNATLRETQRKAFIAKGEALMERAKQAEAAGDALNSFVNGKKKKAQYNQAIDLYNQAVEHFTNVPGGLGGYSADADKEMTDKREEAQKALDAVKEKMK